METKLISKRSTKFKSKNLNIRVSHDELQQIKENAKYYNMTVSEYVISSALHTTIKTIKTHKIDIDERIITNMYANSNNLNQLVRHLNLTRNVTAETIEKAINIILQLKNIYEQILTLLQGRKHDYQSN